MQKWEYGYIYVINAFPVGEGGGQFIVVADAAGNRILEGASSRLAALNILGAQGWIISESPYMDWKFETGGWLYEFIKNEKPKIISVKVNYVHFMRKPQS
jgi:enterochelin esterase-like enzyme